MLILPHLYKVNPKARKNAFCFEKIKLADDKRVSQVKWVDLYLVIEVSDKIQCLVCQQMLAVPKESTCVGTTKQCVYRERCNAYARKIREDQVMKLKSALCKQGSFFTNVSQSSEYAVKASFAIIEMIAKSSRPFHEKGFIGYSLLLLGLLQYLEVHLFVNIFFSSVKFNTSVLSHD